MGMCLLAQVLWSSLGFAFGSLGLDGYRILHVLNCTQHLCQQVPHETLASAQLALQVWVPRYCNPVSSSLKSVHSASRCQRENCKLIFPVLASLCPFTVHFSIDASVLRPLSYSTCRPLGCPCRLPMIRSLSLDKSIPCCCAKVYSSVLSLCNSVCPEALLQLRIELCEELFLDSLIRLLCSVARSCLCAYLCLSERYLGLVLWGLNTMD